MLTLLPTQLFYYRKKLLKRHTPLIFSINILSNLSFLSTHHITFTVLFNTKYYMFFTLPYFFLLFMFNQSPYLFYMYLQHSPYISPYISPGLYLCKPGIGTGTETGYKWVSRRVYERVSLLDIPLYCHSIFIK